MNWEEIFKNFVDSYIDIDKIDEKETSKNIEEYLKEFKNQSKDYIAFNEIKLKTNWVQSNDFFFKQNYYDSDELYTFNIMDSKSEYKNIKKLFEDIVKKPISIPQKKLIISDNYKINRIKLDKIKYFIEYEHSDKKEYIKFNPNFNDTHDIKKLIHRSDIKFLFRPALSNFQSMLTFKLDAIIINYNPKELFKYDFIRKIFEARKMKNKENFREYIEKIKEDRVFIDSKFNSYKFNKNKLNNSNDKILNMLSN